jgi:hypothetical protein
MVVKKISHHQGKKLELVDGALLFCMQCSFPLQYKDRKVVLLTPAEIFERLMSPIGPEWQRMWEEVQTAVEVGRQAVGL